MHATSSVPADYKKTGFNPFIEAYSSILGVKPSYIQTSRVAIFPYGYLFTGVTVGSWRSMIEELIAAGYTISKVASLTGVSRRVVQRWFNGTQEVPAQYKLFAGVLALYCFHKHTER